MRIGDKILHEGSVLIIEYDRQLIVRNVDQLPRGVGAPYLEVLPIVECMPGGVGQRMVYVAKRWARKVKGGGAYIQFRTNK